MTADVSSSSMLLLVALLAASAGADAALRRIPNALPVSIAAVGLLQVVAADGIGTALANVLVGVLLGAVLVYVWRRGLLGGGDVKLAIACTVWLGARSLPTFAAATAVVGGALSVAAALASLARTHGAARSGGHATIRERIGRATVPYGAAIAAGALFAGTR